MLVALAADDRHLLVGARIAELGLDEEAVELGLGQRERSLLLDRVLGREHEERIRQRTGRAVNRDLLLGHRLEQRRLGLRHCAVDLVDEDDVREDRPGPELEVTRLLVVDGQPGDVGRLQVRRALDAGRARVLDRAGDRTREHGLRGARHVLEEHVAATDRGRDDEPDALGLADARRSRRWRGGVRPSRLRLARWSNDPHSQHRPFYGRPSPSP